MIIDLGKFDTSPTSNPPSDPVIFDDNSKMPYGKYKGASLEDVPASYLLWLWDKEDGLWNENSPLSDYIRRSFSALRDESPDTIIRHDPRYERKKKPLPPLGDPQTKYEEQCRLEEEEAAQKCGIIGTAMDNDIPF